MTSNPYAHPDTFEPEPGPSRVSALAVTSLVFGILCCIPTFGLIAMVLGGAAMVAIGRSDGRLTGRGLAIAGLLLGLLGTIWTALMGIGALQFNAQVHSLSGSYTYVEQGDHAKFRQMLTPAVSQQITDEQIAEFHDKVGAAWGKHLGPTKGMVEYFSAMMEAGSSGGMPAPQPSVRKQVMPVPLKFEKGTALAIFQFNPRQGTTRGMPGIENVLIPDQAGNPIWLIPPAGAGTPPPPTPAPAPGGPPPP